MNKTLEYLPNGDALEKTQGWCLNEDKEVLLTNRRGVMGSLFSCPHCGQLWERAQESEHVFMPSAPLLKRLQKSRGVAR